MKWRSRGEDPACAPAARSHSRAPTATLSVAGPIATPPRFSAASPSENKRALVAAAGAAACADRRRVGRGEATTGAALRAAYPLQGPRARGDKKRDKRAARPTVKARDLWRRLPPPVCAQLRPRSICGGLALISCPPPLFARKRYRFIAVSKSISPISWLARF